MALYRASPSGAQPLNPQLWRVGPSGTAQPVTGLYAWLNGLAFPLFTGISLMKNDKYQNDQADHPKTMLSNDLKPGYKTFSDLSPSGLAAGLTGCRTLLVPELEAGPMLADLSVDGQDVLKRFVGDGGHMLLFYGSATETSSIDLLNLFGLNVSAGADASSKTLNKVAAPQIPNLPTDLPATLTGHSATNALICPPSSAAQALYVDEGGNPVVVSFPYGNGRVSYLGWDWFGDAPTAQQADWERVLQGLMNV
ncbi:uncharacterized protein ChrSV_p0007 (plasmid) [Chromobacterium vaccinii]|nr:uncharacterized protein ChrSW_p0007 [Chromobacterium vaccinii]QND87425.1 uncharacterized protein ChrSV_p0007 [Chromobacterium vaccinii]